MENFDKNNTKLLNILDWKNFSLELLRLDYKRVGVFAYLPRDLVKFLHLNKEQDRSLIAFFDDTGPFNFIVITSDRNLSELLKPLIFEKRKRAEKLREKLKMQLQGEKEATKAEEILSNEAIR